MIWDIDDWITIEPGPIPLIPVTFYNNYAMNLLRVSESGDMEALIWPQHRVPWN